MFAQVITKRAMSQRDVPARVGYQEGRPSLRPTSAVAMPRHRDNPTEPVRTRLLRAAERLESDGDPRGVRTASTLRPDQEGVFRAVGWYLTDVATRPESERKAAFARIVQPPRTGKTVVAAHVVGLSGLCATFVVPSRTLVRQTCEELRVHLPGVRVGRFDGERVHVVRNGVNVTTYAMLHSQSRRGPLPKPLRSAPLVFVDEAHHAMTDTRMRIFREAFDADAIRIGLTATPDYDQQRALARYFPDLIHEIALEEAMALGLLAPARVWVAEIDEDASRVRMVGGDFDSETMGRLLSSAPAFEAARQFRYAPSERQKSAMIACASRQQAYDLVRFLERHRPKRSPAPMLLLGDTPRPTREEILDAFEEGTCDTLVQVGVLIEGWTSPRCKLLIDLSPSMSRVRATQKYFRAMTRSGNDEAHLFVLLPSHLPAPPVLPMEIFGQAGEYAIGDLVDGSEPGETRARPVRRYEHSPIEGVSLRQRMLVSTTLARPRLVRGDRKLLAQVLSSCPLFTFEAPPLLSRFRWMVFAHEAFSGHGVFLLRWLGYPGSRAGYAAMLASANPEFDALPLLDEQPSARGDRPCADDVDHLQSAIAGGVEGRDALNGIAEGMRALSGGDDEPVRSPEEVLQSAELCSWALLSVITALPVRYRVVLCSRFGLGPWQEMSLREAGDLIDYSGATIGQRVSKSIERLRERRLLFEGKAPKDHLNSPQGTPEECYDILLDQLAMPLPFVAAVAGELSHLELVAGDLEWLDEAEAHRRRKRQGTIPAEADFWVQEIARALQYAAEVCGNEAVDSHLGALLTAVIVRSLLHRRRPRLTNSDLISLLRSVPCEFSGPKGNVEEQTSRFGRWYLDTHVAMGLLSAPLVDAVWSRILEAGNALLRMPLPDRWLANQDAASGFDSGGEDDPADDES